MDTKKYDKFFTYDKPVEYKELKIYPVKMCDYLDFFNSVNCIMIEKNKIPDPKIIKMSYLDFLFHMIKNDENGEIISFMFLRLMQLCLHIESEDIQYRYDENGKVRLLLRRPNKYESYADIETFLDKVFLDKSKLRNLYEKCKNPIDLIKNKQIELFSQLSDITIESCQKVFDLYGKYNEFNADAEFFEYDKTDFDEIKNIILFQNIPDYDDTYIDPKVEAALKEAEDFMHRNKSKTASLEDQMVCVLISTALSTEQIHNLTIRKFTKILQRVDHKLHYEIYKTAECSGMVTFKDGVEHWLSEIKRNKYSDVIVNSDDYENLKNKIQSV